MSLSNIRLGDYIRRSTANNNDLKYGEDLIVGVTSQGIFTSPKGNTDGVDLQPYKIVENGAFVYTPTRINIGSIAYRTQGLCLVSHLYIIFYLSDEGKKIIDPTWLYMYLRRKEFGREIDFRLFGSARPEFSFSDIADTIIPLPDIETQHKYVEIYNAMISNQQSYERGLDDLKLVCDAYIEELRKKKKLEPFGDYCHLSDERNTNNELTNVKGLTVYKKFIETKADMDGVSLENYKIVKKGDIAYVSTTNRNGDKIACGLCEEDCIISSIYDVIKINDGAPLISDYLFMWFQRTEMDRFARYNSWGSARESISWEDLSSYLIPIPSIETQESIANIYKVYNERKQINEQLKAQIRDICPTLIKGSIEEGSKVEEA